MNAPKNRYLVGICGRKHSGKTTLRSHLNVNFSNDVDFVSYRSFASPIKAVAESFLRLEQDADKTSIEPITQLSVRAVYQRLGDSLKVAFGEDIFIKYLHADLLKNRSNPEESTVTIIDDVRFDNEVNWILKQGGVIIHIEDPRDTTLDTHISETLARNFRHSPFKACVGRIAFVDNEGTIENLMARTKPLVSWILTRPTTWEAQKSLNEQNFPAYPTHILEEHARMTQHTASLKQEKSLEDFLAETHHD